MNRQRVIEVAQEIARSAPAKQGTYVYSAQIPWRLIHELRAALEEEVERYRV